MYRYDFQHNAARNSILCFLFSILLSCSQNSESTGKKHDANVSKVAEYVVEVDGAPIKFTDQDFRGMAQRIVEDSESDMNYESRELTRGDIREFAKEYGLLDENKTNPHLSFLDGDIAYWHEQKLSAQRLRMEFGARKVVLDAADRNRVIIGDQGKLSWAAQQIMGNILEERQRLLQQ